MSLTYRNGYIPMARLVTFKKGSNETDGDWHHSLSPSTYRKHLQLVAKAYQRTGRILAISNGWSAYRPYFAQVLAREIWGFGAAVPGTSSHGGFWEGKQTLAMDYGNWAWVYEKYGSRARAEFYADCRSVGLTPGMIHPSRGNNYPDEPWHVIDLAPWAAVPSGGDSEAFDPDTDTETDLSQEDDMDIQVIKRDKKKEWSLLDPRVGPELERFTGRAVLGKTYTTEKTSGGVVNTYRGFMVTTDSDIGESWSRSYCRPYGHVPQIRLEGDYQTAQREASRLSSKMSL